MEGAAVLGVGPLCSDRFLFGVVSDILILNIFSGVVLECAGG